MEFGVHGVAKRLEESLTRKRSSDVKLRREQRLRIEELEREVAHQACVLRALVDLCLEKKLIARGDLERALRKGRRTESLRAERRSAKAAKSARTARRAPRRY